MKASFFSAFSLFSMPIILLTALYAPLPAYAHSPICNCYDDEEDDSKVVCEGGFSDGASAEGVPVRVLNDRDRVLINGVMDAESIFAFTKPDDDFHIIYDAGPSHQVIIYMDDIE